MTWVVHGRTKVEWTCATEADLVGVLIHLRDYGSQPWSPLSIVPVPPDYLLAAAGMKSADLVQDRLL